MLRPKSIIAASLFGSLLILLLFAFTLGGVLLVVEHIQFKKDEVRWREQFYQTRKNMIQQEVERVLGYIDFMRSLRDVRLRRQIQARVNEAYSVVKSLHEHFKDRLDHESLMNLLRDGVRPYWEMGGLHSYCILDVDGKAEPFSMGEAGAQGEDSPGLKPGSDADVMREILDRAVTGGEGFHEFTAMDKDGDKETRVITFFKYYEPLGLVISIGDYVGDMEWKIQTEVLNRVELIRFGSDGYVFVLNQQGVLLSHIDSATLGRNLYSFKDSNGVEVVRELLKAGEEPLGGFVRYRWEKPTTGKEEAKIAYVRSYEDWGWLIGAGVYLDDVEKELAEELRLFRQKSRTKVAVTMLLLVGGVILVAFGVRHFSKRIGRGIGTFTAFFKQSAEQLEPIDEGSLPFEEFRVLAGYANFMVRERSQAEEDVLRARQKAEAASLAKSEFLANMSHEMRTPLNGLLGMLQLLEKGRLGREQKEYVRIALSSGRSLLRVINDVLSLSQIEAGKMHIIISPFSLGPLVASVMDNFGPQCDQKGVRLSQVVDPRISETLHGDEGRIRQILFNLVGNAVKFTKRGTVRVEVWPLKEGAPEGKVRLVLRVADSGIGIPDEKLEEVFDPFTQVDGSFSRRYQGTGLGLGIVKRLVDLMDGTLCINSELGVGTEVYCRLDLAGGIEQPLGNGENGARKSVIRLKVLVAEDDNVNRMMASRFLETMGHKVIVAENGEQALSKMATEDPDCVLMDIQMPVMDGMEATRAIRESKNIGDKANIPIIAVTAHAMEGDKETFLAKGMDGYISKPLDFDELKQLLDEVAAGIIQGRGGSGKGR